MFQNTSEMLQNGSECYSNASECFRDVSECFRMLHYCFRDASECFRDASECFRMIHWYCRMLHECFRMLHWCFIDASQGTPRRHRDRYGPCAGALADESPKSKIIQKCQNVNWPWGHQKSNLRKWQTPLKVSARRAGLESGVKMVDSWVIWWAFDIF